jgi:hypothetical protein
VDGEVVFLDELWRRKMYISLTVEEVCPPAMVVVLVEELVEPLLAAMEVRSEAVVRKKVGARVSGRNWSGDVCFSRWHVYLFLS